MPLVNVNPVEFGGLTLWHAESLRFAQSMDRWGIDMPHIGKDDYLLVKLILHQAGFAMNGD